MPERGTVLAFDFGLKRIGVAVGEPELRTAHPTSAQGEPHKMTRQAEDFARRLEKRFKLPVARVDERYTSVEAESRLKGLKNKAVDSVAAQLILEQYFDQAA
jgi:putative holliday junction resolvase